MAARSSEHSQPARDQIDVEFDGLSTGNCRARRHPHSSRWRTIGDEETQQEGLSTMITSREIRLKSRPDGMPSADNFELATVSVSHPAPGEVQVENLWMTVDPYMRNRMAHRASYAPSSQPGKEVHGCAIGEIAASNSTMYGWRPPFQLGDALEGGAIGEVAVSDDPRFNPGDLVSSVFGWRERFNAPAR